MRPLIPDSSADERLAGLERFLERYLGPRRPEFGVDDDDLHAFEMPGPLQRLYRFAGRWPGHNPASPYANRFCIQDHLGSLVKSGYAPQLRVIDGLLVFVWENQGVWVAATDQTGADPPVWIAEDAFDVKCPNWRRLDNPLSHFLVSFVLLELTMGSTLLSYCQMLLMEC